tara:strand:- start:40 stop:825 length:786 start_codon:yes stop_codon:yes gene_type:complete
MASEEDGGKQTLHESFETHRANLFETLEVASSSSKSATFCLKTPNLARIEFPQEVAFSTIDSLYKCTKQASKGTAHVMAVESLLLTDKRKIVMAVRAKPAEPPPTQGKKRGIDEVSPTEELVSEKLEKSVNNAVDDKVLQLIAQLKKNANANTENVSTAEHALRSMGRLRGQAGERALQSFSATSKKLGGTAHSLLISASFNSGVCIRLSELKQSLGSLWKDGQFAVETFSDFADMVPPLSSEGTVSLRFGNYPLLLLTSV